MGKEESGGSLVMPWLVMPWVEAILPASTVGIGAGQGPPGCMAEGEQGEQPSFPFQNLLTGRSPRGSEERHEVPERSIPGRRSPGSPPPSQWQGRGALQKPSAGGTGQGWVSGTSEAPSQV